MAAGPDASPRRESATTQIQIRPANPDDARAVSDLACRAKAHWGYPEEWMAIWREELTLTPEYLVAHDAFVAVRAGALVGLSVLECDGDAARLEHVWVDPACHMLGIGRALVDRALEAAARRGVRRVAVVSDPYAESFYLRLSAQRTGAVAAPMPGAPDRVLPVLEFVVHRRGAAGQLYALGV